MLEDILKKCRLCPRDCAVDRTNGEVGYCKADDKIKVVLSLEHAHLFDKETQTTIIN